jgi:oligoribonuclease NrnB/cAMP/cGMP phosphodiesterase (DHH superfamily)
MLQLKPLIADPRTVTVLYHAGCPDGYVAALLLWYCCGDQAQYVPVRYDDPVDPQRYRGRNVILVDFSFPRDVLLAVHQQAAGLAVLDHHRTAEENLQGLDFCCFDLSRSGAALTFDAVKQLLPAGTPHSKLQLLVSYVQDRDLWTWALPNSRAVSAALSLWPRGDFAVWANRIKGVALEDLYQRLVDRGDLVLERDAVLIRSAAAGASLRTFEGLAAVEVNSPLFASELGERLGSRAVVVLVWSVRSDGVYRYELRTQDPTVDVSALARLHGGGGHRQAAGFVSPGRV